MKPMINPAHKGALHKFLGVKQGEKLSTAQLITAHGSPNPKVRKMAQFAINSKSWNHSK
jgi:hypothetical protein